MTEDTKAGITAILDLLRKFLIAEKVSMAVSKVDGTIYFFDTKTYVSEGRKEGFGVTLESLVK